MAEARARSGPVLGGPGGRTMDPGTEEYELNGDLRPGSPGSPDASVSTACLGCCVTLAGAALSGPSSAAGTCGHRAR